MQVWLYPKCTENTLLSDPFWQYFIWFWHKSKRNTHKWCSFLCLAGKQIPILLVIRHILDAIWFWLWAVISIFGIFTHIWTWGTRSEQDRRLSLVYPTDCLLLFIFCDCPRVSVSPHEGLFLFLPVIILPLCLSPSVCPSVFPSLFVWVILFRPRVSSTEVWRFP